MTGNVSGIVEAFFPTDRWNSQPRVATETAGKFSDYLDLALLNGRTGLFTGSMQAGTGYPFAQGLSGSIWQTLVLKALQDQLKKKEEAAGQTQQKDGDAEYARADVKKKPDWATIRVLERYRAPAEENAPTKSMRV